MESCGPLVRDLISEAEIGRERSPYSWNISLEPKQTSGLGDCVGLAQKALCCSVSEEKVRSSFSTFLILRSDNTFRLCTSWWTEPS